MVIAVTGGTGFVGRHVLNQLAASGHTVRALARTPVWAFHGAQDPVVPVADSEWMVEALRQAGGDARLTVYPEAGHDAWTAAYADPALYSWFLAQRRRAPAS